MPIIVDTNVPIVADGRYSPQATIECQRACLACVESIISAEAAEVLVVDFDYIVIGEYRRNLQGRYGGGIGEVFLQWVLGHAGPRVRWVKLTHNDNSFDEFPKDPALSGFDPADHKWVAAARAHQQAFDEPAPIVQAVDMTKWLPHVPAMAAHGIEVRFICRPGQGADAENDELAPGSRRRSQMRGQKRGVQRKRVKSP
jgi:hypothetical protein